MKKEPKIAIYPGTFDPVTLGHLDLLKRASLMFDEVIVALSKDSPKKSVLSLHDRLSLLNKVVRETPLGCPVRVETFGGLLIDFARRRKARIIVRGLRAVSDFEYELQIALMNRNLFPDLETVFLMPDEKFVYLSSSIVREVGRLGGNLVPFVPSCVRKKILTKLHPSSSPKKSR